MSMSKQHYEAVAAIIKAHMGPAVSPPARRTASSIAGDLAVYFKTDNPAFNTQRFMKACGISDEKQSA